MLDDQDLRADFKGILLTKAWYVVHVHFLDSSWNLFILSNLFRNSKKIANRIFFYKYFNNGKYNISGEWKYTMYMYVRFSIRHNDYFGKIIPDNRKSVKAVHFAIQQAD